MLTILKLPSKTRPCFEVKGKHSTTSRVSPSLLLCSSLLLRALQQNEAQSTLLYFLNKTSI